MLSFGFQSTDKMTRNLAYLRNRIGSNPNIVPILLIVFMLASTFFAGIQSGVDRSIGLLDIDITALTAAISAQSDGLKDHPYQGYTSVYDALKENGLDSRFPNNFRNYETINDAMHAAANTDVCGSPLYSQLFNDQGLIEFAHDAFWLFGINVKSLYYFYFVLLGCSVAAYLVVFWRSYAACALLFACLVADYAFMPSFLRDSDQLISVSNPRFLSTLGIIPIMQIFITFLSVQTAVIRWRVLVGLVFQAALLSFVILIRSSALWAEIAFALLVAGYIGLELLNGWRGDRIRFSSILFHRGAIAIYVVAALFFCNSARTLFLLPNCGIGLGMHSFWHDVYMGFASHPGSQAVYGFGHQIMGDSISYEAAKRYVQEHHLPYQTEPSIFVASNASRLLGAGGVPFGSWQVYEGIMRALVFDFVRTHPRFAIETFLISKPLSFIHGLRDFYLTVLRDLIFTKLIILVLMIGAIGRFAPSAVARRNFLRISPRVWMLTAIASAAVVIGLIIAGVVARNYITTGEEAVVGVLAPFLFLAWLGALAPPALCDKEDSGAPTLRFQHIVSIVGFLFVISMAPLIVALPNEHLIADQASLATVGILVCLIWAVGWEKSWGLGASRA